MKNLLPPPATFPAILLAITLSILAQPSFSTQSPISIPVKTPSSIPLPSPISIPIGGNAWSNHPGDSTGGHITPDGIVGWTDPSTSFTIWFRVSHPGTIGISLLASVPSGSSTISISLGGGSAMTHTLTIKGSRLHECNTGSWTVLDTGYQVVVIRGLQRSGTIFANIQTLSASGPAVTDPVAYVPNNEGDFFYWGRRGPSVHFNYDAPNTSEYFYNEVTVPEEQDVIGSYFMADGFSVGYFGMQVNSATQRRILFSVWSPFSTDNPAAIPDSLKVRLVKKGQDVHTGSFGNEGSGGQSYFVYPWVAGHTYGFLLRAQPLPSSAPTSSPTQPTSSPAASFTSTPTSSMAQPTSSSASSPSAAPARHTSSALPASLVTRFTAWFYAPEEGHWRLIASWDRPATHTWLQHLHSFLENFEPDYGDQGRRALFSNQWTRDSSGHWTPLTRARFTGDNTARKGYRLDYAGGSATDGFWLRNGGFFSTPTPLDTWFSHPFARRSPPDVDLSALP